MELMTLRLQALGQGGTRKCPSSQGVAQLPLRHFIHSTSTAFLCSHPQNPPQALFFGPRVMGGWNSLYLPAHLHRSASVFHLNIQGSGLPL